MRKTTQPMARRRSPRGSETAARAVAELLDDLAEADYRTADQVAALRCLAALAQPGDRASLLVERFAASWPVSPELFDHDQLTRLAGFLVLAAGRSEAQAAVSRYLASHSSATPQVSAVRHLAAVFELPSSLPCPQAAHGRALAQSMPATEDGVWQALAQLAAWRAPAPEAIAAFLAQAAAHPKVQLAAARAAHGPFDAATRDVATQWLARHGLSLPPDFPGVWPVHAAYATAPDGFGSQTIFVVRRRSPRSFGFLGVVTSSLRGIADAVSDRRIGTAGLQRLLANLASTHGTLFRIPIGHAMQRIRTGLAVAAVRGIPLPFEYLLQADLLAGLWDEPAPCHSFEAWERSDRAEDTAALFEHPALGSWFLTESDGEAVSGFLQAAATHLFDSASRDS
ncbi:MAG: hypothetical protein KGR26_14940, partial [Cyanobacteria bacterium REEB65]|nr:hypothetical protein [Cyanobacteria bacterium REEB65]